MHCSEIQGQGKRRSHFHKKTWLEFMHLLFMNSSFHFAGNTVKTPSCELVLILVSIMLKWLFTHPID